MVQRQEARMLPQPVEYRATKTQRVLTMGAIVVLLVGVNAVAGFGVTAAAMVGALVGATVSVSYTSVTLDSTGIAVRGWPRRAIPWSRVRDVRVKRFLGSRRVVVYESGGRRVRLPAPLAGPLSPDRTFAEKAQTIQRWWMAAQTAGDDPSAVGPGHPPTG